LIKETQYKKTPQKLNIKLYAYNKKQKKYGKKKKESKNTK
jgi:hypothetical protein